MANLKEEAEALARDLGVNVKTEGLSDRQLQETVARLRAQKEGTAQPQTGAQRTVADATGTGVTTPTAPTPTGQPGGPPPNAPLPTNGADSDSLGGAPAPTAPKVEVKYPYQVAPGKSITSVRGIIDAGQEVNATDFVQNEKDAATSGQERLDALVQQGVVLKR